MIVKKKYFENSVATCAMPAEDKDCIDLGAGILLVPSNAILDDGGFILQDPHKNLEGIQFI